MSVYTEKEKEIIYKCANNLLKMCYAMKNINTDISFKMLKFSDVTLSLLEKQELQRNDWTMCNGHTNNPKNEVKLDKNTDDEIETLVRKIRSKL